MSLKDVQQEIVSNMTRWRKVENATVLSTSQVISKTENPVIRLVMEIIQRDSQMHHRIQEWISDSIERKTITMSPDELAEVWDLIEHHIELEKKSVDFAKKTLAAMKGADVGIVPYLLSYLLKDEEKHTKMLEDMETVKRGTLPPYAY